MSERIQHTAAALQEKMFQRYGDDLHHKHNKNHMTYRKHCKTHPSHPSRLEEESLYLNESTGLIREFKLRKVRKRLDKGQIH
ncbi:MAG: hypothetical protein H0U75_02345 [Legionella sp.]|nr:hypothetical protein [Legionella sp.]